MSLNAEVLLKHKTNDLFIETGTYVGWGIEAALNAGYREIHSIELYEPFYRHCKQRFCAFGYVNLYHGDSSADLKEILNQIDRPATFWLDAHLDCLIKERIEPDVPIPLLHELSIIAQSPIKNHTILIDDRRLLGNKIEPVPEGSLEEKLMEGYEDMWVPITEELVNEALMKINPGYQILIEDSPSVKQDIIVAKIRRA